MKKALLVVGMLLFLTACEETAVSPFVPVATSVQISPKAAQLEIGDTLNMTATVYDQRGDAMTNQTITWTSNNIAVATVSNAGVVIASTKGQTIVGAAVGTVFTTANVFVVDPTVVTVAIQATVPSPFYVGQTVQATAVIKDAKGRPLSAYATTWQSSNTSVATVSSTGLITAVSAGTTTISLTSGGKTATLPVTVTLVPVATITLAVTDPVYVGRTVQVTPILKNSSGATLSSTQRTLVWASMDTTIATVTHSGVLRGVGVGTTTLTCVVENKVGILSVTVSRVGISYATVIPDSASVVVGGTKQFVAKAFDADSTQLNATELDGRTFVWTIGNNGVAVLSVTTPGLVTGVAVGTTTVTATLGAVQKSAIVVVEP